MERIDGTSVSMAIPYDQVVANIRSAERRGLRQIHDLPDWREDMSVALVGGGPSLCDTIDELRRYKNIMVCGSAHDHIVEQGIVPRWCVVCDPDAVMANYLRKPRTETTYLIASMCAPETFDALRGFDVAAWNCGGDPRDNDAIWGRQQTVALGGGTTVGMRAIIIAMVFGFSNIHLFGFDTCVSRGKTHCYDMATPRETVGDLYPIRLGGPDGPEFLMAKYHVSQLFDFKETLRIFGHRIRVTVHGDGVLAEIMRIGKEKANQLREAA